MSVTSTTLSATLGLGDRVVFLCGTACVVVNALQRAQTRLYFVGGGGGILTSARWVDFGASVTRDRKYFISRGGGRHLFLCAETETDDYKQSNEHGEICP